LNAQGLPTVRDVLAAARRLDGWVWRTALAPAASLVGSGGEEVLLKLESQQRTGSFKVRGALNAVLAMDAGRRAAGLVTASAGNHGLGVALAARSAGVPATVFVPEQASPAKTARLERFGAELRRVPGGYDEAHEHAAAFAERGGGTYVHAFSDPDVVAGQGTVALEILIERPDIAALVVPVGGGGLIGGCGIVARALSPELRVIGVQSSATSAMHRSLTAGRCVSHPAAPTVCDGLEGDVDERSLALARRVVDELVLVEEDEIRAAMRALYVDEGIVAEGSAAVVAAALRRGVAGDVRGPIAAVVSGGNLDAALLARILAGG
jgi:threonine dehydratase